jgi:hypothetical protein
MVDVFEDYFDKKISEKILRKEAVLIYQVGASAASCSRVAGWCMSCPGYEPSSLTLVS